MLAYKVVHAHGDGVKVWLLDKQRCRQPDDRQVVRQISSDCGWDCDVIILYVIGI